MEGDTFDDNSPILAAPHYYFSVCGLCQSTGTPKCPLKRCSRCHAMFYCSSIHQKAHWKLHKNICNYFSNAMRDGELENFFSGHQNKSRKEWNQFRMNAVKTILVILSKPLRLDEQEMFLFPRVCRTTGCYSPLPSSPGSMLECQQCQCVVWCSVQHRDEDHDHHQLVCRHLRLGRLADRFESQVKVGIPSLPCHLDQEYLGTAPDMTHFVEEPFHDKTEISTTELEFAFLTNQLSGPLTLLDIGHRFDPDFGSKTEMTIHIVGANVYEVMGIIKWEYLAHRLPSLTSLTLTFIGPELEPEDDGYDDRTVGQCQDCSAAGKLLTHQMNSMTYKQYKQKFPDSQPDLVIVQNCGFHEYDVDSQEWSEGWKQGISYLLPSNKAPVIFTSYTKTESENDLHRFLEHCGSEDVEVLIKCQKNTMRSYRPIRDWEMDNDQDVFYSNQYINVVKQK